MSEGQRGYEKRLIRPEMTRGSLDFSLGRCANRSPVIFRETQAFSEIAVK